MNYHAKRKIVDAICRDETLFIKNTGVSVKILEYCSPDRSDYSGRRLRKVLELCNVQFLKPANKKSLSLCNKFTICRDSNSNKLEVTADVEIKNLSLYPYESKGAKVLYDKTKKNK